MLNSSKEILDEILCIGRAYVNPTKVHQKAALVELEAFLSIDKRLNSQTWICTLKISETAIDYIRDSKQGSIVHERILHHHH